MKALVSIISISSINYYLSFLSFFYLIYSTIILFLTDFISFSFLTTMIITLFAYFLNFFIFLHLHFFTFSFSLFLSLSLILPYSFSLYVCSIFYPLISNSDSVPLVSKAARILAFLEEKLCLVWLKARCVRTYVRSYVINWMILCSIVWYSII